MSKVKLKKKINWVEWKDTVKKEYLSSCLGTIHAGIKSMQQLYYMMKQNIN